MKKMLGLVVVLAGVLVFVVPSMASFITLTDNPKDVFISKGLNDPYSSAFDLSGLGAISGGSLKVYVLDDPGDNASRPGESFNVVLNGVTLGTDEPVGAPSYNVSAALLGSTASFQVQRASGDFMYDRAELTVQTGSTAHTPIPGTVWLFGLGLTGLVALRKRSTKN